MIDGHSRLADTEHLPDEKATTTIGFFARARAFFAGRRRIGLERLAVNLCDGPLALPTTVPVKAAARRASAAGVDVELSMSAGTFVCNAVFYRAAAWAAARGDGRRAGFVHVPSADVAASAVAVRLSLDAALDVVADDRVAVGATD